MAGHDKKKTVYTQGYLNCGFTSKNGNMRKTILLTVLLTMLPSMLLAQQGWKEKLELSANISGESFDIEFGDYYYYAGSADLASIYGPQKRNISYTPVFSLMGEYKLKNRFSLGLELAYSHIGGDYYDPFTDEFTGVLSKHMLAFMPGVKYRYFIKKYFALHSGASAGAALQFGKDGTENIFDVKPAIQVIPIGMRVGNNIYATLDYYLGNVVLGVRLGIGYRF